jgi:hypothetical protein
MLLPKDKAQIGLVLVGIFAVLFGSVRTFSESDHVQPEMMTYGTKGAFITAIPKEAGPWLLVGGLAAFGICFFLRRK